MNSTLGLLQRWVDAFNDKDLSVIEDCYADEIVNHQIWRDVLLVGKEKVIKYRQEYFDAFPDVVATVCNLLIDGEWASVEWRFKGSFQGKFFDYEPTGKSFELKASSFVQIVDGQIKFQRDYWDRKYWAEQLGIGAQ